MFHFPPSLYDYIVNILKKPFLLVLNKIDLISKSTLESWLKWFDLHYPLVTVIPFSSFPQDETITCEDIDITKKRKARKAKKYTPVGVKQLLSIFDTLYENKLKNIVSNDSHTLVKPLPEETVVEVEPEPEVPVEVTDDAASVHFVSNSQRRKQVKMEKKQKKLMKHIAETKAAEEHEKELLTNAANIRISSNPLASIVSSSQQIIVGTIGHPNAGKSSLINSIFGRPMVSVSETPGHTKHLQTLIFNEHTQLCDCKLKNI
jgi:ribosome biogenesis GTPase A